MVKAVPSHKNKDWFYLLQAKLGDGLDGTTWRAKRKEESIDPVTGQRLGINRQYFCIK